MGTYSLQLRASYQSTNSSNTEFSFEVVIEAGNATSSSAANATTNIETQGEQISTNLGIDLTIPANDRKTSDEGNIDFADCRIASIT